MSDEIAVRTDNLSKTFGRGDQRVEAVKALNLEVHAGQVYGFLGPNGAGKSTTIRMLMDLIRPSAGVAYLFGHPVREHHDVFRRVGAMVETPGFYDYLTGRENLKVLALTASQTDPGRVERALEQVRLTDRADRPVSGYSTGMRQRLGIAAALLGDPELVILDEPTNGLDPAGIQEMRGFIRGLVESSGKTVFLSSHILHEVEQVCDRVAIISRGECVREGEVQLLLGERMQELRIQAAPVHRALQALEAEWQATLEEEWLTVSAAPDQAPAIVRRLVESGVEVHQVVQRRQSLEELFMEVTDNG